MGPNTVRIGVEAPKDVVILREEIADTTGDDPNGKSI
ncbi:carbon storage regulator [Klebsiella pneumoniae]